MVGIGSEGRDLSQERATVHESFSKASSVHWHRRVHESFSKASSVHWPRLLDATCSAGIHTNLIFLYISFVSFLFMGDGNRRQETARRSVAERRSPNLTHPPREPDRVRRLGRIPPRQPSPRDRSCRGGTPKPSPRDRSWVSG